MAAVDDLALLGCPPGLQAELYRSLKTGQTTTRHALVQSGVSPGAVTEIHTQVNSRTGNEKNLALNGIPGPLAGAMAAVITASPA